MPFYYKPASIEIKEIIDALKTAGKAILKIYQSHFKEYQKADKSPVTEADIISNKIILSNLKKYNYGILSEESEDNVLRLSKEKIWIVDPLDGTRDFLQKTGDFSIMVGLVEKQKPVLGFVYKPIGDKMYFAEKGKGSFLKEGETPFKKLQVSKTSKLSDACFLLSRSHLNKQEEEFIRENKPGEIKYFGSIGVKIGLIAEGKADAYLNISSKTCQWDTCAPEIILREAGGAITDLKGREFIYNRKEVRNLNGVIAGNKEIHQSILDKISPSIKVEM